MFREKNKLGHVDLLLFKIGMKPDRENSSLKHARNIAEKANALFEQNNYSQDYLDKMKDMVNEKPVKVFGSPLTFEDPTYELRYEYFITEDEVSSEAKIGRKVFLGAYTQCIGIEFIDKDINGNPQEDIAGFLRGAYKNLKYQEKNSSRFCQPEGHYFDLYDESQYIFVSYNLIKILKTKLNSKATNSASLDDQEESEAEFCRAFGAKEERD